MRLSDITNAGAPKGLAFLGALITIGLGGAGLAITRLPSYGCSIEYPNTLVLTVQGP